MARSDLEDLSANISSDSSVLVLQAEGGEPVTVPGDAWLLRADFSPQGSDLLLTGQDGSQVLIKGFFLAEFPPDLMTESGAVIPAELAVKLAGPMAPGQFALLENGPFAELAQGAESIGRVEATDGLVEAIRIDGSKVTLTKGDDIFQGDTLLTAKGAAIGITFIDDTTFSLGEEGRMVIDEMVYDAETQEGQFSANLVQGVFSFVSGEIAKTSPDAMTLSTPVATIGIRGTKVAGRAAQEGAENTISLLPEMDAQGNPFVGELLVTNQGGTVTLSSVGATVQMTSAFDAPPPPVIFSPQQIQQNFGAALTTLSTAAAAKANDDAAKGEQEAEQAQAEADQATAEADAKAAEADAKATEAEAALAEAEASGDPDAIAAAEAAAAEAEAAVAEAEAAKVDAESAALEADAKTANAEAARAEATQANNEMQTQADAFSLFGGQPAGGPAGEADGGPPDATGPQLNDGGGFNGPASFDGNDAAGFINQVQGAFDSVTIDGLAGDFFNGGTMTDDNTFADMQTNLANLLSGFVNAGGGDFTIDYAQIASNNEASYTTTTSTSTTPITEFLIRDTISGDGSVSFRLDGGTTGDAAGGQAGYAVSSGGDLNNDGFDDMIVGAPYTDYVDTGNSNANSGSVYVIYGKASGFAVNTDLSTLDGSLTSGFRLDGIAASDRAGTFAKFAGDLNGDGFDDIIIGANYAGSSTGAAYIILGKATTFSASDTLNNVASMTITGAAAGDNAGYSANSAGDINGDGYDDLTFGSYKADIGGTDTGSAYVIYGKSSMTGSLALGTAANYDGTNGIRFDGVNAGDQAGYSVNSAGDVNGDGIDDLIIGAQYGDVTGQTNAGVSYVVFGKSTFSGPVALSSLDGTTGFRIDGQFQDDHSGRRVSDLGDINGDGYDDIFVGAPYADPTGNSSGAAYIIFGKSSFSSTISLTSLNGSTGFRLNGEALNNNFGYSASGIGDVNGDGVDDFIVSAIGNRPDSTTTGSSEGSAYVIYGKTSGFSASINVATLPSTDGFRINGYTGGELIGSSLSGGDVNGDGFDDIMIGVRQGEAFTAQDVIDGTAGSSINDGLAYVYFGSDTTNSVTHMGTSGNDTTLDGTTGADVIYGAQGNDTIGGLAGADRINGGSGIDTITGGAGADSINGGGGADIFVYTATTDGAAANAVSGFDTISDFVSGTDKFHLSGALDTALDDITADSALVWQTDVDATVVTANFNTTTEALLLTTGNSLGYDDITTSGWANMLTAINANTITAGDGDDGLIVVQGGFNTIDTVVFYYLEDTGGTSNSVEASELTQLAMVEGQQLVAADFTTV